MQQVKARRPGIERFYVGGQTSLLQLFHNPRTNTIIPTQGIADAQHQQVGCQFSPANPTGLRSPYTNFTLR